MEKKYELLQWYPSLKEYWLKGDIAEWFDGYFWNKGKAIFSGIEKDEVENNPDFWQLIKEKKPLFVTDDNIKVFDDTTEIISVSVKHHTVSNWQYRYLSKPLDCENFKHFGDEKNADKYIEENKPKPLFTTEDGVEVFDGDEYYLIGVDFKAIRMRALEHVRPYSSDVKRFKHESNANEYIWKNKMVFSYEDMECHFIPIEEVYFRRLENLAKERANEK